MKLKNALRATAAAVALASVSFSASAGFLIYDKWQLKTNGFSTLPLSAEVVADGATKKVINIGDLILQNLFPGTKVTQELNGSGEVFVGAKFKETGGVFSINATRDNKVGLNDDGGTILFSGFGMGEDIRINFADVTGSVTKIGSTGFAYKFDNLATAFPPTVTVSGSTSGLFSFGNVLGIGGNNNNLQVIGGVPGSATILAALGGINLFGDFGGGFDVFDSTGKSLLPDMLAGKVLFQAITTNTVSAQSPLAACPVSFATANQCRTFDVSTVGNLYLVRVIPEPGSMALMGLALFGLGAVRRFKKSK